MQGERRRERSVHFLFSSSGFVRNVFLTCRQHQSALIFIRIPGKHTFIQLLAGKNCAIHSVRKAIPSNIGKKSGNVERKARNLYLMNI